MTDTMANDDHKTVTEGIPIRLHRDTDCYWLPSTRTAASKGLLVV